jgi:hypothetical protein
MPGVDKRRRGGAGEVGYEPRHRGEEEVSARWLLAPKQRRKGKELGRGSGRKEAVVRGLARWEKGRMGPAQDKQCHFLFDLIFKQVRICKDSK